jgi:hypothetical protein
MTMIPHGTYTAGDGILHSGIFSRGNDVFNRFICHLLPPFKTFWNLALLK